MIKYRIVIEKMAEKFIIKLPKPDKERVLRAIHELPAGNDIKRLKGRKSMGFTGSVWAITGLFIK